MRENYITMLLLPGVAAAVMGLCAKGVYMGMQLLTKSNVACLVPSIIIAIVVYAVMALKIGAVRKEQLLAFPKGKMLVQAARKCRLLS